MVKQRTIKYETVEARLFLKKLHREVEISNEALANLRCAGISAKKAMQSFIAACLRLKIPEKE